ncbi:hypothetical protein Avbf_06483 [Armadillidium vulgare]|nr:hypothetical protein Avbf_06483 [Armadillidium vulgare]
MFREFWGNSTNIPPQSIKVTITAPTPAPRKSLLGDFPDDLYRQCQSPSHISVNQPVPRSSPPPDRISEMLYQFGTLDQPSTSRAGLVVESPHKTLYRSLFRSVTQPHTSHINPVPLVVRNNAFTNQPSSFPHLVDNSVMIKTPLKMNHLLAYCILNVICLIFINNTPLSYSSLKIRKPSLRKSHLF